MRRKDGLPKRAPRAWVRPRLPLAERFWRLAERRGPDECWPWKGSAEFCVQTGEVETPIRAAWRVQRGPIPEGHAVVSKCRPTVCVNADHLSTGPNGAQGALAGELGKALKGEQVGTARLTEAQVVQIRQHAHDWADITGFAHQFGVSASCVRNALIRKTWKHVA